MRINRRNPQKAQGPNEDVSPRCQSFMSQCRTHGVRLTTQRMAVFRALSDDTTHPTADSLYSVVRRTMPSLSLSTVYRILDSLESEGLIRRVSAGNGVARYDANLGSHQHLICRVCGSMTDFEDESLSRLRCPPIQSAGFSPEELDIRVIGICRACNRSASGAKRSINDKRIRVN